MSKLVKCISCGKKFDPKETEERFNEEFNGFTYDDCYDNHDVCFDCAWQETADGLSAGAEIIHLMGPGNAPWE